MPTTNYKVTTNTEALYFTRFIDAFDAWRKDDGKYLAVKRPTNKLAGVRFVWTKLSVEEINSIAANNPSGK